MKRLTRLMLCALAAPGFATRADWKCQYERSDVGIVDLLALLANWGGFFQSSTPATSAAA